MKNLKDNNNIRFAKKILSLMVVLVLIGMIPLKAFARSPELPENHVLDKADVLSVEEEIQLDQLLYDISKKQKLDISVVTVTDLEGKSIRDFADDFYDNNGLGYGDNLDGALLVLDMDSKNLYISTDGFGIDAFTDYGIEHILDKIIEGFGDDKDYYAGLVAYANTCDELATMAREGKPFDVEIDERGESKGPFNWLTNLFISLGIGGAVGILSSMTKKSKLTSVRKKYRAEDYIRQNSMKVNSSADTYLYTTFTRTPKPKPSDKSSKGIGGSSVHTSSSGRTHGGGGRGF